MDKIRLHSYMAKCGYGSRRHCEELILAKKVSVNGVLITTLGYKVSQSDIIEVDGKNITPEEKKYIALHKPVGYLCSNLDKENRPLAIDLLSGVIKERLFHVGRLDFMSSGLIFYTNDGEFANIITHPSYQIIKEYIVETREDIPEKELIQYAHGITIENVHYQLKTYKLLTPQKVSLTIIEGKNREIRKVFLHFNLTILSIHRIKIGNISINGIQNGGFRYLSSAEIDWFLKKNKIKSKQL